MTKLELADYVGEVVGLNGVTALKAVNAVIEGIKKGCDDEGKVVLRRFGTFKSVKRPARTFKYYIAGGGEKNLPERTSYRFIASPKH